MRETAQFRKEDQRLLIVGFRGVKSEATWKKSVTTSSEMHRGEVGAVMRNKNLFLKLWITIITSDVLMGTVKVRMYSGIVGSLHLFESTINADWSTQDFYTLPSRCCLF